MSKFVDCGRDQAFLLPPDLRDRVPEDDLAHFVIEAVERVGIGAFEANDRGTGSAQYHPRMMRVHWICRHDADPVRMPQFRANAAQQDQLVIALMPPRARPAPSAGA